MRRHDPRRRERGAIAVTTALLLIVLGGFLALGINVGHIMKIRNQLQNAVDAAALAGVMEMAGTPGAEEAAHAAAEDYAERHLTDQIAVAVDRNSANLPEGDIVHGVWDFNEPNKALAFTPADSLTPPSLINALLVRAGRETARGNPLDVVFSVFLGATHASVGAEAVAVGGGPCEGCSIPIAFADCLIKQDDGSLDCGARLQFATDTSDNIGFTNLDPDPATHHSVNTADLRAILQGGCSSVGVGDVIGISNGNQLSALTNEFDPYVGQEVTAPIIQPDGCDEGAVKFNQPQLVVGFATFTIIDVVKDGSYKAIEIELQCDEDGSEEVVGGCGEQFGTTAPFTRLVR